MFGLSEPGLAGKMADYISIQGELHQDAINAFIAGLEAQFDHAADLALDAWGADILEPAGLASREHLREALGQLSDPATRGVFWKSPGG